ncbi:MAG: hypothetical protein ACK42Z_02670 [Candidatus Kapaibacteriota bacterium]
MKFLKTKIVLIFLILLNSCSKEETLIENGILSRYFYVVFKYNPQKIQLLELPSGKILDEDVFYTANGKSLDFVTQIAEFRGYIYFIQPKIYKVTIAKAENLKVVAELDWGQEKITPSSIAFINATTGFISFSDTGVVKVLDLLNFNTPFSITTSFKLSVLDIYQHYVLGLSSLDGNLVVLDSRTYSVDKNQSVGDFPLTLSSSLELNKVYILIAGKGKFDSTQQKTPAKLVVLDVPNFTKTTEVELNVGDTDSKSIVPTGIVVSGRYFGYVSTLSGLLRFSLVNPSQFQRYIAGEFFNMQYDYKRDEIIALSKVGNTTIIYLINPNNAGIKSKFTINDELTLVFPK